MKNILKLTFVFFLTVMMSCSDDDNSGENISNQVLQGKVFDEDFTALGGKSFEDGKNISINITNVTADCSSTIFDYDFYVSTTVLAEVGVYDTNVVFHKKGETPKNISQSSVEITSITDSQVVAKIKSNPSSENNVDGTFTVSYCK